MPSGDISDSDYRALAEFRHQIRRYLRFSEHAARQAGIEPQQHQLMLAIRGMPDGTRATIREVAERLQIQHHSTVELVDRLVKRGLLQRHPGGEDRREVLLQLTAKGEKSLRELSLHHQDELQTAVPELLTALRRMMTIRSRPVKTGRIPAKAVARTPSRSSHKPEPVTQARRSTRQA